LGRAFGGDGGEPLDLPAKDGDAVADSHRYFR
jgi:hypothetical protein